LEGLLRSPARMRTLVADELRRVKESYSDRRRTQIARLGAGANAVIPMLTTSYLLPEREIWVAATADGLVARTLDEKPPRPSGMAAPRFLLQVNTRDTLFLVSTKGEAAGIPIEALPETDNPQNGAPHHKISALPEGSELAAMFTLPPKDERLAGWNLFTATRQGLVKKTDIEELPGATGKPFTLVKVNEDDALGWVQLTNGLAQMLLVTADGMAIRFSEDDVRPMGLVAAGVGGIKLGVRDEVVGMALVQAKGEVLLVSADGKAKRMAITQFPVQGRYGQGVIAWKLPRTTQVAGMAVGKPNLRITLHLDKLAPKSMRLDEAPQQTRAASGKPVIEFKKGVKVLAVSAPLDFPRPSSKPVTRSTPPVDEETEAPPPTKVEQLAFGLESPAPSSARATGTRKPRTRPATSKPASNTKARRQTKASTAGKEQAPAERKPRGTKSAAATPKTITRTRSKAAVESSTKAPAARKPRAAKATAASPESSSRPRRKTAAEPSTKTPATRKPRASKPADAKPASTSRRRSTPAPSAPAKGKPARKAPATPAPKPSTPARKKPAGKKPAKAK
jgi:hypothetical protein